MRQMGLVVVSFAMLAARSWGQAPAYRYLSVEINKIQAVDDHTHVPRLTSPSERDDEYDALPCSGYVEASDDPSMARPDNSLFLEAWQKLYGYKYQDKSPEHVKELVAAKARVKQQQGDHYPAWVLDQLGIEYMLANRIAMGRGLDSSRFLWVPFDDALLYPLDTQAMADTPDRKFFYKREAALVKKYVADSGLKQTPAILDNYVDQVLKPTLEQQKKAGAVAIKFEEAYLRSLNFAEPNETKAREVFAQYAKGGAPSKMEYTVLQDYLFRVTTREAGRLGLAVHIHTGAGCGSYFDLPGSNPGLLSSVLNDPTLRKTNFVLVHGGAGPYTKVAAFLIGKPNVYADFSEQDWMISPHALSVVLRDWLEWYPEKVMFGTDLFPGTPEMDWEEIGYMTAKTGREALTLALAGMVEDGEITRERAVALARMVLRGNAVKIYGLADQ